MFIRHHKGQKDHEDKKDHKDNKEPKGHNCHKGFDSHPYYFWFFPVWLLPLSNLIPNPVKFDPQPDKFWFLFLSILIHIVITYDPYPHQLWSLSLSVLIPIIDIDPCPYQFLSLSLASSLFTPFPINCGHHPYQCWSIPLSILIPIPISLILSLSSLTSTSINYDPLPSQLLIPILINQSHKGHRYHKDQWDHESSRLRTETFTRIRIIR